MATADLTFRAMTPSDAPAVAELARRADPFSWTVKDFLTASKAGNIVTLGFTGDVLVGFYVLRLVLDESELMDIAVDPAYQSRGFGRALLTDAIKTAKLSGARLMHLEVRIGNVCAKGLYEAFGFKSDAVRRNYYRTATGREDAVLMTLGF